MNTNFKHEEHENYEKHENLIIVISSGARNLTGFRAFMFKKFVFFSS
jgi:hypothetical protein